ncbi:ATP-binding protein [Natronosalvus halobius]|uniref:ATP-binding protein n=1 Tax=Natronosalvus halobius TaxID=2953746 RepID=UPI0020A058BA|nr:ATP-binding protein [Natronosalvus halobius]USZ71255.1 ATP-binding protein [Natronosalvus halobius]
MASTATGKFDLNMEEVLEAWGPADALRELLANALDEQALTDTAEPEVFKRDGCWHIRDYGRGLRYDHLTQSEDEEKLANPDTVIGKFGVGLKDSLATCHRHGIDITIHSTYHTFSLEHAPKHGFEDISTLHVHVQEPQKDIEGTEVVLDGIIDEQVEAAKQNFLRFSDEERLEETRFGEVYRSDPDKESAIYVTGLKVATEENFLFSYNITNTTKQIRDALNRERSNVGRTAYTARVKRILQACESEVVATALTDDMENFLDGTTHDELQWKPIQVHAVKVLNARRDVVVATAEEQGAHRDLVTHAHQDGYEVVTIPNRVRDAIADEVDTEGDIIRDLDLYRTEYNESFEYEWVDETDLTDAEREVWELQEPLFEIVNRPPLVKDMRISETLRVTDMHDEDSTLGVWEGVEGRIIVKRDVLADPKEFLATVLHEVAHPMSGAPDQTLSFEHALTQLLGQVSYHAVQD